MNAVIENRSQLLINKEQYNLDVVANILQLVCTHPETKENKYQGFKVSKVKKYFCLFFAFPPIIM
jgi:hypothetical protein